MYSDLVNAVPAQHTLYYLSLLFNNHWHYWCFYLFSLILKKIIFMQNLIPILKQQFHYDINGEYQRNKF